MPGPFHGIDLASRALRNFQRALDVTGHNIANVGTRGYSRQTVDLSQTDALSFYANGQQFLGTGVTISTINRIQDMFGTQRLNQSQSEMGKFGTLAANMKDVVAVFNEPGTNGIHAALEKFFDSWSGLASNPNESANRLQVQLAGRQLTDRVRTAWSELDRLETNNNAEIAATTARISELGNAIAGLNAKIREALAANGTPNDLLDQREIAIRELSNLANVTTRQGDEGTMSVYISEFTLVDAGGSYSFPTAYDATTGTFTSGSNRVSLRSGELAGLMQSLSKTQSGRTQLDALANQLRTSVNALHMTGTNPNSTTNILFFNDGVPQTGAQDFDLSAAVASDSKNIANSTTGAAGDGALALSIANLRSQNQGALGARTFSGYYQDAITLMGNDLSLYNTSLETQDAIMVQTENQVQAVSGVSLDDEMANLLRFQRSYQAAAKLLAIFDQVAEDLITMVRR